MVFSWHLNLVYVEKKNWLINFLYKEKDDVFNFRFNLRDSEKYIYPSGESVIFIMMSISTKINSFFFEKKWYEKQDKTYWIFSYFVH